VPILSLFLSEFSFCSVNRLYSEIVISLSDRSHAWNKLALNCWPPTEKLRTRYCATWVKGRRKK